MIKLLASFTLASLMLAALIPTVQAAPPNSYQTRYLDIPVQETGVVDVVADGDTFRFIEDGTSEYVTVRLLGVILPKFEGLIMCTGIQICVGAQKRLTS